MNVMNVREVVIKGLFNMKSRNLRMLTTPIERLRTLYLMRGEKMKGNNLGNKLAFSACDVFGGGSFNIINSCTPVSWP